MAAHDARRAAWNVSKNPIVGAGIPPRRGITRIAVQYVHIALAKLQTLQIGGKTLETAAVAIDRGEPHLGKLEQMRRLSSRRGTGIQHTHAVGNVEKRRRQLCSEVLHGERPFGVAGKLDDGPWRIDDHS